MTERALPLKPWQVQAALDGRLGMVMRPVVPAPFCKLGGTLFLDGYGDGGTGSRDRILRNPYHSPGTELWVQETWKYEQGSGSPTWEELLDDRDGGGHAGWWPPNRGIYYRANETPMSRESMAPWNSSATMHRDLSRLTFRVLETGAKRLGEVTEEDLKLTLDWRTKQIPDGSDPWDVHASQWNRDHPKHPWATDRWAWWARLEEVRLVRAS